MTTASETHHRWEPGTTYVVGHQRPDTDAIASALGYAWFLTAIGQDHVLAARAGQPAEQTTFALQRFEQAPPRRLGAVAPTFGHAVRPQAPLYPTAPLSDAMARLAQGERVVPLVDGDGRPNGVITPMAIARAYCATNGGANPLSQPCGEIVEAGTTFPAQERISDHRSGVLRSGVDDFLVTDDDGRYLGIATRGRVLDPPRARLILVDHNELSQAVAGAEEADIAGVLDHHRLGNAPTALPIPFVVEPVGSTSTLVAEQCRGRGLEPPPGLAGMLLSGILSDTLVFRSPTTTARDRRCAAWLGELAGVEIDEFGSELLRASAGLSARAPGEIVDADRKSYQMGEETVSVAQVEVGDLNELPDRREELLAALDERRHREALSLICLMVTDVVSGRSHLLCQGKKYILAALPFARLSAQEFDLGRLVSRKKQLIPALHGVVAGGA